MEVRIRMKKFLIFSALALMMGYSSVFAGQPAETKPGGNVTAAMLTSDKPVEFDVLEGKSTIEFIGKSFMHHFEGISHEPEGFTKGPFNNALYTDCEIKVPVNSLEGNALGGKKDDLSKNIHENLESDKYPFITFKLKKWVPGKKVDLKNGEADYLVQGDLTIHNVTKSVIFPIKMDIENGYLHFKGEYDRLNVHDYGVEPKPLMSIIHVGDHVDVKFDIYEDINTKEKAG